MGVGRRQVLLGGLGLGLAAAAGPRASAASREEADASTGLQHLRDRAGGRRDRPDGDAASGGRRRRRETGTPLFLPAGIYSTSRLDPQIGHPDRRRAGTIGPALSRRRRAAEPGEASRTCVWPGSCSTARPSRSASGGALLAATEAKHLDLSGLPLPRQRRGRRGAAQGVGLDQGLRDRRHPQSAACSARTRPGSRSRITMCATAATTAFWCGGRSGRGRHHRVGQPHRAHRRQERRQRPER